MEPIFGDPSAVQSLGMPSSWSVDISQPVPATEQLQRLRTKATDIIDGCVRSKVDRSFIDAKKFVDMKRAVAKLAFFLHLDLQSSGVGRQISACPQETNEIIRVVGVKSPNTIMKRMNALLSYYRWDKINMEGTCYPMQEGQLWQNLRSMADDGSAATTPSSMVQAVRFAWFSSRNPAGRETGDKTSSSTFRAGSVSHSQDGFGRESDVGYQIDVCSPSTDVILQMS